MITGESGTGTELMANLVQEKSNRNSKPFLTINCNTFSEMLLESELFGYEKGSFTGADTQRKGKFEIADGGTIFLDEIGDISPRMHSALLRVLQNDEITRVGGHKTTKVDVRIIAATNKDLAAAVRDGTFRLDLFYRLNVINLVIPPLRKRKEDIFELTKHFIQKYSALFDRSIDLNPRRILQKLKDYDWPGNVRELENVIHRAVLMCKRGYLRNRDITFDMMAPQEQGAARSPSIDNHHKEQPLKDIFKEVERQVLISKLKSNNGSVVKAAKSLEICKSTFYEKMKQHGITLNGINA